VAVSRQQGGLFLAPGVVSGKVNSGRPRMDSQRVRIVAPERIELAGDVAFFKPPPGGREVQIDLRGFEWNCPIGIVGLLALHFRAHELGLAAISTIPPRNDRVRDYLHQTGFVSELEMLGEEVAAETW